MLQCVWLQKHYANSKKPEKRVYNVWVHLYELFRIGTFIDTRHIGSCQWVEGAKIGS